MRLTYLAFVCVATITSSQIRAAEPPGLTVNQCLTVFAGLEALRFAGAQLNDVRPAPPDAKQYKLGEIRGIAAFNMAKLQRVTEAFNKARNAMSAELAADKPNVDGANFTIAATAKLNEGLQKILESPCDVTPDRIKLSDLRLGDDAEHNQIPPSVLSALSSIIDK